MQWCHFWAQCCHFKGASLTREGAALGREMSLPPPVSPAICLRARYAMSSTDRAYNAMDVLRNSRY
eukprot:582195-Rhodomonas_salina.2